MTALETQDGYLSGQLLIAMPQMTDPRFEHSVVYMCAHNADGAMGLVVNKLVDAMSFTELLRQMELEIDGLDVSGNSFQVHVENPVLLAV